MQNENLLLVIQVYNEEDIVLKVLSEWSDLLQRLGIDYEIYAINDGSRDNTQQKLDEAHKKDARIIPVNKQNEGHGSTILRGYKSSIDKFIWVFQVDSDNELPAMYFEELWKRRDQYDFLVGKRCNRKQPLARKIISLVSRMTIRIFYGK